MSRTLMRLLLLLRLGERERSQQIYLAWHKWRSRACSGDRLALKPDRWWLVSPTPAAGADDAAAAKGAQRCRVRDEQQQAEEQQQHLGDKAPLAK